MTEAMETAAAALPHDIVQFENGNATQDSNGDTIMEENSSVDKLGGNTEATEETATPTEGLSVTSPIKPPDQQDQPKLSKNALKRLRRQQAWEERKQDRRLKDKQKKKEKKEAEAREREEALKAKAEAGTVAGKTSLPELVQNGNPNTANGAGTRQKRKAGEDEVAAESDGDGADGAVVVKKQKIKATQVPITIIIDCGFDDLMHEKEIVSLSSQITRSYSDNRNSPLQVQLSITSLNKRLKQRMETTLHNHHKNWKRVKFSEEDYEVTQENREKGDLIYLSSDSDYTLETLEEGKTYVVGGIVDRNRHKGICYKKATEQGIKTAKLPIGEYIRMASRVVLTTNQVVEIMLKWLECRDWQQAFLKVIPQRKGPEAKAADAKTKSRGEEAEDGDEDYAEEEGESKEVAEAVEEDAQLSEVNKDEAMEDIDKKDELEEVYERSNDKLDI